MQQVNLENSSCSSMKNNKAYLNIPSLRFSLKSVISRPISSRSYKEQSPRIQNTFIQENRNQKFTSASKNMKEKGNVLTPEDEKRTQISTNQENENLLDQSYLMPMDSQIRSKRSKSSTLSPTMLDTVRPHRYSESINPSFLIFQNEISKRRQLIQKTKKQVEEFNIKNVKLLDDIKKFREQMSKRTSINMADKKPINFIEKTKRKTSLLSVNSQQKKLKIQNEEQKKVFSDKDFIILKKLGSGTFAKVFSALQKSTGFLVTLKKISLGIFKNQKCFQQLITEIKIQTFLDHPNVLKIYGFYVNEQNVTLVLEFMEQGNLYEKIMKEGPLNQNETSQSIAEILFALDYLHENNIVHRDLKPQNVLLSYGVRKLCDFGTASICEDRRSTVCGTLDYTAPQLVEGKEYNITLDLWNIGIMTFQLLTSKTPFFRASKKDTIKKIAEYQDGQISFSQNISQSAQKFITSFLVKDPQKRPKIKEALNQQFILNYIDEEIRQLRQKCGIFHQKSI